MPWWAWPLHGVTQLRFTDFGFPVTLNLTNCIKWVTGPYWTDSLHWGIDANEAKAENPSPPAWQYWHLPLTWPRDSTSRVRWVAATGNALIRFLTGAESATMY